MQGEASTYQQRIFEFVASGHGHGVIRATAGSGKTTTLLEVAKRLPDDLEVCFLAFSKDAATELQRRLPDRVEARTVHSAGFRAMATHLRASGLRPSIADDKYERLVAQVVARQDAVPVADEDERRRLEAYLLGLLTFARLELADLRDVPALEDLARRHGLEAPASPELAASAPHRLREIVEEGARSALTEGVCDYDDLLYLPHVKAPVLPDLRPRSFDLVFVDEAQDYSRLALAFTMRLCRAHGRMLFVGDPRQSIFGFAGADPGAMERIVRTTGATLLPLSVSYRCPRAHVRLARLLAPEIEPAPGAARGSVRVADDDELEALVPPGALVLSRTNATLLPACLRLVRAGLSVRVRGHDLVTPLRALAARLLSAEPTARLRSLVERHLEAEARRIVARQGRGAEGRARMSESLTWTGCLTAAARPVLHRGRVSLAALDSALESSFAARGEAAVVCSTIHRAKGQEAGTVVLLDADGLPSPDARTREDMEAEACVMFVALTRAREALVLVRSAVHDPRLERAAVLLERAARTGARPPADTPTLP